MLRSASEGFIERSGDFDALDSYVHGKNRQIYILTAAGGMGKTSLLARWIDRLLINPAEGESLHYRFIGTSDGSTSVNSLLRSILDEIKAAGKFTEEIPPDSNMLRAAFPQLLEAAGRKGRTVIVLDGLNQLESQLTDLAWLPLLLPPEVRLIASFTRGGEQAERYCEQLCLGGQVILAEVRPFETLEDRRRLVWVYLAQYLKELDERHVEALISAVGASNPLYLKVVLAELRLFGAFANLGEKIREGFGTNAVAAFNGVLQRLEDDPVYSTEQMDYLVPRVFGWLAHAHRGLTVEELCRLLLQEKPQNDGRRTEAAVNGLLRQVRPYLARRDGRLDFYYESFKLAVLARYVRQDDNQGAVHPQARLSMDWHASLAKYFSPQPLRLGAEQTPNQRKLAELSFQLAYSAQAEALNRILWDYAYMEARLEGADVEALIADYDLVGLPEAGFKPENTVYLRLLQDALKLSEHVLRRDPAQLPSQLTGRLLGFATSDVRRLLEQLRAEVKHPWLRPLHACLDAPGGALLRTLAGHTGKVKGVALTPDGRCVVSASEDTTLKVLDLASGACLRTLQGHRSSVECVALTPDGRHAVSASWDHTLKVWDLASGECLRTLTGHTDWVTSVALTPDGRCAISASNDHTLKMWDLASGECLQTLLGHTNVVTAVALSPDGRRAVSASQDMKLRVWDLAKNKCLRILRGHTDAVNSVAVMPDGLHAVSVSNDRTIKIWNIASGECLRTLPSPDSALDCVTLAPDGRCLAAGSSAIKLLDLTSGECLRTLDGHTSGVSSLALTPDGRRVVSGSWDDTIKVWNLTGGEPNENQVAPKRHTWFIESVVMAADGQHAVSASRDNTLKVWDLASGECLRTLEGHTSWVESVTLTPDGRFAVSTSADKTLKVWDLASGICLRTLKGHVNWVIGVVLTPDGRTAISASQDGTLKVWDLASGEHDECLRTLSGHTDMVDALALTPDGRCVVSASWDHTLKVWDVASGKCQHTLLGHAGRVFGVGLTPNGHYAVSICENHTLKVWDLASGECLRTLKGHTDEVTGVAFTPDGRRVVSASHDRTLKVWDVENGECLHTLRGHSGWVTGVALTPDGRCAFSASHDRTVRVWDLASGACLAPFPGEGVMECAGSSLTGQTFSAGDLGGAVYFLRLENVPPAPPILTAWSNYTASVFWKGISLAFGCPYCRTWPKIQERVVGTEISCPHCGKLVRLNPFTINGDWRAVAKVWMAKKVPDSRA
jgi:WD40 repeat protein